MAGSNKEWKKKRRRKIRTAIIIMAVILLICCAALLFAAFSRSRVYIELYGPKELTLEYGTTFEDAGASAFYGLIDFYGLGGDLDVQCEGEVDTLELGDYTLSYTASMGEYRQTAFRTVHIVDTTAPVIALYTIPGSYTLPGEEYVEEGYEVWDACDGDLTEKVIRSEEDGMVFYSVEDRSGNTVTATRKIFYDDRVPPELILGEVETSIAWGEPWVDSYTAYDNVDGDITSEVAVEGYVDSHVAGEYTIKYSVIDSANNAVSNQRTVEVRHTDRFWAPVVPATIQLPEEKVVFLTFDDGPGPYTDRLLDILAKYDVKATFFVTDQYPDYEYCIAKEYNAGHTVGVHSLTHDYSSVYASDDAFWYDFNAMNSIVEYWTGRRTALMRFPGGSSNTVSFDYSGGIMSRLTDEALYLGYDYYDWNVSSGDAGGTTSAAGVCANVIRGIEANDVSVVLMHDIHGYTVDAVESIIEYGIENGYTFLPLQYGLTWCRQKVAN